MIVKRHHVINAVAAALLLSAIACHISDAIEATSTVILIR